MGANLERLISPQNHPFKGQTCGGPLLIIGGGRCVWNDLEKVGDLRYAGKRKGVDLSKDFPGPRMAINDIGQHYMGHIDHWVTSHPEFMGGWMHYRQMHVMSGDGPPMTHSLTHHHSIDVAWPFGWSGGTSGLLAVFVGLAMGFDSITLAGVPMDDSGHYFDPPAYNKTDFNQSHIRQEWINAERDLFGGRVRSMSGWTAKLLGTPDGHAW